MFIAAYCLCMLLHVFFCLVVFLAVPLFFVSWFIIVVSYLMSWLYFCPNLLPKAIDIIFCLKHGLPNAQVPADHGKSALAIQHHGSDDEG